MTESYKNVLKKNGNFNFIHDIRHSISIEFVDDHISNLTISILNDLHYTTRKIIEILVRIDYSVSYRKFRRYFLANKN